MSGVFFRKCGADSDFDHGLTKARPARVEVCGTADTAGGEEEEVAAVKMRSCQARAWSLSRTRMGFSWTLLEHASA